MGKIIEYKVNPVLISICQNISKYINVSQYLKTGKCREQRSLILPPWLALSSATSDLRYKIKDISATSNLRLDLLPWKRKPLTTKRLAFGLQGLVGLSITDREFAIFRQQNPMFIQKRHLRGAPNNHRNCLETGKRQNPLLIQKTSLTWGTFVDPKMSMMRQWLWKGKS